MEPQHITDDEQETEMQDIIHQFRSLKINDGSSGVMQSKKKNVKQELSDVSYYALALPEKLEQGDSPLVFDTLKAALASLKCNKGARLKAFQTKEESINWAINMQLTGVNMNVKESSHGGVTPQQLVQLRKSIESGETELFLKKILANPKMLIGKTDTPSILQEGTHINSLHVSAKCDKPIICQLILDILENQRFLEKLYPLENASMVQKRKIRLLDLYINTPDKVLGESALHYASKFGSVGCVRILLSHPFCIQTRNIYGKTPEEIICSRSGGAASEEITEAFKNIFYVTLFKDDFLSPPMVTKPSLKKDICWRHTHTKTTQKTSHNEKSDLKITAFAGPMAIEKALTFYHHLKNPELPTSAFKVEDCEILRQIKRSDPSTGFQRIARLLAEDLNVDFFEYFSFLNIFANFSQKEGLNILESYIRGEQCTHKPCPALTHLAPDDFLAMVHISPKAHSNSLAHDLNVFLKNTEESEYESLSEEFFTPPSSPNSEHSFVLALESPMESKSPPKEIFLKGFNLTKHDVDVLLAIGHAMINVEMFPSVFNWKNEMEKKLRSECQDGEKMKALTPLAHVAIPRLAYLQDQTGAPLKRNSPSEIRKKLF